ncbi:MAG: response regulator [Clostridia bacterium]|nr:response regulator [Clostridia bacterium]
MNTVFDPATCEVDWSYRSILVVEDIEANYKFLEKALQKTKARILHATTGTQAISMCANDDNIDLVLMDVHLPGINGYDATREIKKMKSSITVIAQTAFVLSGERQKAFSVGCDEYIAKPIRSDELIFKIKSCLLGCGKNA